MIVEEIINYNGKSFKKSFSNNKKFIKKVGTNEEYIEAIDVIPSLFKYEETDKEILELKPYLEA